MNIGSTSTENLSSSQIWRHRFTAAAVGLFLLVLIGCSGSGGDTSGVIFSIDTDGGADVFIIETGNEAAERLTSSASLDISPAWSPDGKSIAFISDRNGSPALWVMDASGEEKRQLAGSSAPVSGFRWSPDSVRIAVEFDGRAGGEISILDIDSAELTSLTLSTEDARLGDWSPDGEWVVYSVSESDQSAVRRRNPTGVDEITLFQGRAAHPRWSRNGQFIAFNRLKDDGSVDLVVMDKDGKDDLTVASDVNDVSPHDWSPDSKRLVYLSGDVGESEIYVVGRDGKDATRLTSNRVAESAPIWSSDGASILFISEGGNSSNIFTMNGDGGDQQRITSLADVVLGADW